MEVRRVEERNGRQKRNCVIERCALFFASWTEEFTIREYRLRNGSWRNSVKNLQSSNSSNVCAEQRLLVMRGFRYGCERAPPGPLWYPFTCTGRSD